MQISTFKSTLNVIIRLNYCQIYKKKPSEIASTWLYVKYFNRTKNYLVNKTFSVIDPSAVDT
jgi:hypothetical protein